MSDVKLTDNSDEALALFEMAIKRGLEAVGMEAENNAKVAETLVDTGRLRNSITWALEGKKANIGSYSDNNGKEYKYKGTAPKQSDKIRAVYVGSNVEYAEYVEYGTHTVPAQHFLQDACQNHGDKYKSLVKGSLQAVKY